VYDLWRIPFAVPARRAWWENATRKKYGDFLFFFSTYTNDVYIVGRFLRCPLYRIARVCSAGSINLRLLPLDFRKIENSIAPRRRRIGRSVFYAALAYYEPNFNGARSVQRRLSRCERRCSTSERPGDETQWPNGTPEPAKPYTSRRFTTPG